ncbi:zinc finger BED domain-containing protein RICESLEEPER 2 [Tanacetum coccineum]
MVTNPNSINKCCGVPFIGGDRDPIARFYTVKKDIQKKARNDPTMSSEYEQYLKADFVSHLHPKDFATFDVLGFWKAKENQFPVLSRMTMDILSVQASSVASESAFNKARVLNISLAVRSEPERISDRLEDGNCELNIIKFNE